jgi:hypothetical protein
MGNIHLVCFRGRRNCYCILFRISEGKGEDLFGSLNVGRSSVLPLILNIMMCGVVCWFKLYGGRVLSLFVTNNAVYLQLGGHGIP